MPSKCLSYRGIRHLRNRQDFKSRDLRSSVLLVLPYHYKSPYFKSMPINWLVRFLSAEWMLNTRPNGGTVIFLRALWVSALVFGASILVSVCTVYQQNGCQIMALIRIPSEDNLLPIAAATFAFAYTALYARFASQWSYLANPYNQIMTAKVAASCRGSFFRSQDSEAESEALQKWQAGFIEDAEELHLATKPMFASVIVSMLEKPGVREWFIKAAPGGVKRLNLLEARVMLSIARDAQRF